MAITPAHLEEITEQLTDELSLRTTDPAGTAVPLDEALAAAAEVLGAAVAEPMREDLVSALSTGADPADQTGTTIKIDTALSAIADVIKYRGA